MKYIAGIHLSHAQGIESIVTASTLAALALIARDQRKTFKKASTEGGNLTAGATTLLERLVTPIHGGAQLIAPLSYLRRSDGLDSHCRCNMPSRDCLGDPNDLQDIRKAIALHWSAEKGEIVSVGPYGFVRHPLYSVVLGQLVIASVAYWSWIPLASCGICLGAFVYKIPVEERLMEGDSSMGPAYLEYKRKVPYRILPYIW
ncbi:hypothetical protein LENED_004834 [Lentinula edodes]|uniref:Protein-S-isoprenylcysteine O-methyltransferase n=1 Tax=Lentinula edodes TaxID=5353 RepID=A0A1Q3E7D4_LENED|nr:hypothetical protein LENED_004834 [Lentinula edodes]